MADIEKIKGLENDYSFFMEAQLIKALGLELSLFSWFKVLSGAGFYDLTDEDKEEILTPFLAEVARYSLTKEQLLTKFKKRKIEVSSTASLAWGPSYTIFGIKMPQFYWEEATRISDELKLKPEDVAEIKNAIKNKSRQPSNTPYTKTWPRPKLKDN